MDKLHYDNLYKFLVSLGIILIVLPIAALIYLFNMEPILISQSDYDLLSEYSLQMIANRTELSSYFIAIFPWFGGILIFIGAALFICGISKWFQMQKNLDKKLDTETTIQTLTLLKMNDTEITAKIEKEANETTTFEAQNGTNSTDNDTYSSIMNKHIEIKDLCFNYFTKKYTKRYTFERDIRMGKYCYDFIGVSQSDNIDLVVEVRYFRVAAGNSRQIYDVFEHLYKSGINYETIAHRNFRCIVVVVVPKEQLPRLERIVETYCKAHRENASKIEIKCFAEEAL